MKAAPGTHTLVGLSPAKEPRTATVSPDGNTLHDEGGAYTYHPETDDYRGHPPPPLNEQLRVYKFSQDEGFNVYEIWDRAVWIETGRDYPNG